jgi:protein gp37
MADYLDNEVPEEWRHRLFDLIDGTPHLDWLLLTKRIGNAHKMLPARWLLERPPNNVSFGISVGTQADADRDIPKLRQLPARVRFLSCEPLLEPIAIAGTAGNQAAGPIHWVITGAESGSRARPMELDWVRGLRDQCLRQEIAFFFKQDVRDGQKTSLPILDGARWDQLPLVLQHRLME